eukprot:TRINITY_DN5428_c0_g1_i1.p1 TRINITY_DN5428_c0_g1~~TRINITY_DN5428_c0_g1_i1.p1  ORF type:complete len:313 (+),score=11.89 TRINITY_DN5428_c0_g1_i1:320-1258(+)
MTPLSLSLPTFPLSSFCRDLPPTSAGSLTSFLHSGADNVYSLKDRYHSPDGQGASPFLSTFFCRRGWHGHNPRRLRSLSTNSRVYSFSPSASLTLNSLVEPSAIFHTSASSSSTTTISPSDPSPTPTVFSAKRRLILLRHAKSSWADPSLRDHDRPLSNRGLRAAANIAKHLLALDWVPSLILCSDSLRTRQTLDVMCETVAEFASTEVRFLGSYYSIAAMDGQTAQHLKETVVQYADSSSTTTVMCMGHNRGWEEAASVLSGTVVELKTANAALLEARRPHPDWALTWKEGWRLDRIVKPDRHEESEEDSP